MKSLNALRNIYFLLLFLILHTLLPAQTKERSDKEPKQPTLAGKIVEGAEKEVQRKTLYKETYELLKYPMGDVPPQYGVCTDLVIRAFRNGSIDIQKLLHEDRSTHPKEYPTHIWDQKNPDKNIDHRRCQNLVVFFKRYAEEIDKKNETKWKPGDVIFFVHEGKEFPWHVGIISRKKDREGHPMMYHLFPPCANEYSTIHYGPIDKVYRWKESQTPEKNKNDK